MNINKKAKNNKPSNFTILQNNYKNYINPDNNSIFEDESFSNFHEFKEVNNLCDQDYFNPKCQNIINLKGDKNNKAAVNPISRPECSKPKCLDLQSEIVIMEEEVLNLENKLLLLEYTKSEQLIELTEKISELNEVITNMLDKISYNEGNQLENLDYPQLTSLERNLLTLLLKIKTKISDV